MSAVKWPSFLVATGEKFLAFDGESFHTIEEGRGVYYGITWSADRLYCHRRNGPRSLGGTGEVVEYSLTYQEVGILPGDFPDAHQIFYKDGKVYVTSTSRNAIGIVDIETSGVEFKNWTPFTEDVNHINSLWFDGVSFWVGCHNYAEKSESRYDCSQVFILDENFEEIRSPLGIGLGLHNIVVIDGKLYVCSSADGKFIEYDLEAGEVTREFYVGEWLRGVAVTDDYILLGASATLPKEQRLTGDSGLFLLDRQFNVLDSKVIVGCGPVYDLRVIGQADYAHNGLDFPGGPFGG